MRFERFVKGTPIARFVGDLVIVCRETNLIANVRFAPYDAAFAEKTGARGNVVSGSVRAFAASEASEARGGCSKNKITQTLRVVLGVTDGDIESCRVVPSTTSRHARRVVERALVERALVERALVERALVERD